MNDRVADSRRAGMTLTSLMVICVGLVALGGSCYLVADWWSCLPADTRATYVGRRSCIECHQQETELWRGSHHDLAMDLATAETVLGDFSGVQLEHYGVTSTMFQRDGQYFVRTEGPDGRMGDFQVKYVFGVEPLQQYLVEFDRPADMPDHENARLQVLRVSWDTEQNRWFYLSPPDVDERLAPDDPLHWTGSAQNWNHMCADCHSTNLQKRFDVDSLTYHTTFSEIDVSCEACHGPGSIHVQLARGKSLFWDRKLGYGLAKRLKGDDPKVEIQACAPCHSRRRVVHPDQPPGQDYYDCYANEVLLPGRYYADGQILDEVYVYGSFLQSKMYHQRIRCTDCHDAHTTRVKLQGNDLCTSCHSNHPAAKYDTPAHHRHKADSTGASCVACHMPETPYMDVDFRRDHSLRIPRPDLSVDLGVPNACTGCHLDASRVDAAKRERLTDYSKWMAAAREGDQQVQAELERVDQWSADWIRTWYGEPADDQAPPHFASALDAAWRMESDAVPGLLDLARNRAYPAIARASALVQLSQQAPQESWGLSQALLEDRDPQVRAAAIGCLESMPNRERLKLLTPLLRDPTRLVRTEAARALADFGPQAFDPGHRLLREQALAEYRRGLLRDADQAMAHMGLGLLAERQQDWTAAIKAYETAMRVQPGVTGPRTNLAALLERLGRAGRAAALRREELDLLARDATLAPDSAPVQYRYGLSLYLHERMPEAIESLRRACELEPNVADYRLALTLLHQRLEHWDQAEASAERLIELAPDNPGYRNLLREIRARTPPQS
jgi:tetratricopeptide (TPR) repeat protein